MIKNNIKLTIKKTICVLSISACMMSLAACGKEDTTEYPNIDFDLDKDLPEPIELTTASEEETKEETTEELSTDADATESEEYKIGIIDGNIYTNDYFGFSIELPDDMTFLDDAALVSYGGLTPENKNDEYVNEYLNDTSSGAQGYIEVYGLNYSTGASINAVISISNDLVAGQSKEEFINIMMSVLETQVEAQGMKLLSIDPDTVNMGGKEELVVKLELEQNGVHLYEAQAYFLDSNYLCAVTVGAVDEANIDTLLGYIKIK